MLERVVTRAPATTANMGPGFDCLGMALDIWNTTEVEVGPEELRVEGEGADTLPRGPENLVHRAFHRLFQEVGRRAPTVRITCRNGVPVGRGLGSSAAAVVGGLLAANEMCGRPLGPQELLELAAQVEGHPDNVAPALLGGMQLVVQEGERLITVPVPVPSRLGLVLLVPDMELPTREARAVLPRRVDLADAVYNVGRAALLVRAMTSGDLSLLRVATGDRLHQPARRTIFPAMGNIFRAALMGGALGVFLSGAGPTVLALVEGHEFTVGCYMLDAAQKSGLEANFVVSRPSTQGAYVVEAGPP